MFGKTFFIFLVKVLPKGKKKTPIYNANSVPFFTLNY